MNAFTSGCGETRPRVTPLQPRWALACLLIHLMLQASPSSARGDWVWVEGEDPVRHSTHRHSWYHSIDKSQLSGGDMISHFDDSAVGDATYEAVIDEPGEYELWVRCNPIQAALSYTVGDGELQAIDLNSGKRGEINIALDGKPDLRFLAWIWVGKVSLEAGTNTIRFRMSSNNHHHGYLDCFVLTQEPFAPRGALKPDEVAAKANEGDWFAFDPSAKSDASSEIDLSSLNESVAGENGYIVARDGKFWHGETGMPVRFWAVNGPPHDLHGDELRTCARLLARYGVNLVRIHGAVFDQRGEPDFDKIRHVQEVVRVMKDEGIYSHLSIYFPLWFRPPADLQWLEGYNGEQRPFAALFFNPAFQTKYREWVRALLTSPDPSTGEMLLLDPAVLGLEIQNEDSLFFWTFDAKNVPDPQLEIMESQFAQWLVQRHGSADAAIESWQARPLERDRPAESRIAFRPLWNIVNERTERDLETTEFLLEKQSEFYRDTYAFVRELGFRGLIHASNWATASPERLGPFEKLSYLSGDFIDRHGYFDCDHQGKDSAWSIREGHTYRDRSALRFAPKKAGEAKSFVHPVMDLHHTDKPSMISETTFTRPNRFRSEAPLYYAAYGALQDTDAIVHFALDGAQWQVKPNFHVQPWTLASPAMMGQFPAAALLYRRGLIHPGEHVAEINLNVADLRRLGGTPLPENASFDELRLSDVPPDQREPSDLHRVDPLIHYTGQTRVRYSDAPTAVHLAHLKGLIDRNQRTVRSSTGELHLDYGKGLLRVEAPQAQGVSGALSSAQVHELPAVRIESTLDLGHVIIVSLDGAPLASSQRMLLQVMSEEEPSGFEAEAQENSRKRIASLGTDPWLVRNISGQVSLRRDDASELTVTALDSDGRRDCSVGTAAKIRLLPTTLYYLIAR